MKQSELAKLRKLAEAATPGVWTCEEPSSYDLAYPADECPCRWDDAGEYEYVGELADGGHVHLCHEIHRIGAGDEYVAGNYDYEDGGIIARADRDYIIAAQPATVLALLDALEKAETAIERVREMHYPADNDPARTPRCEECQGRAGVHPCGCWADEDRQPVCGHCNAQGRGERVPWPCPTIQALDGAESA